MAIREGLTLFTSDSRPKYANDAVSVLALPDGLDYRFRYESKYIPSNILHLFENENVIGTKLLIAFKSEVSPNNFFIVPIRRATLTKITRKTDFYILNYTVNSYPSLVHNDSFATFDDICRKSNEFIKTVSSELIHFPVFQGLTSLIDPRENENNDDSWLYIAKALAQKPNFSNTYFLKISRISDEKGIVLKLNDESKLEIEENQYIHIAIDYFALNFSETNACINVSANSQLLRLASNANISLDSRYDSIMIWLQTLPVLGDSFTEIEILTSDSNNSIHPIIKLQIEIKKSKNLMFLKILTSVIGAILIALPGILQQSIDNALKIIFAALGAITISIGMNLIYPRRK